VRWLGLTCRPGLQASSNMLDALPTSFLRVTSKLELHKAGSARSCLHLDLDCSSSFPHEPDTAHIPGSSSHTRPESLSPAHGTPTSPDIAWETGDHVAVFPRNSKAQVRPAALSSPRA
jgi:hypothetical protein